MKLATFDLEIAKVLPADETDWTRHGPLGISCAAIATEQGVEFFRGVPCLSQDEAADLVGRLIELSGNGYTLVTWNGCSFDFRVLAQESGLGAECALLALTHVDLMLCVTFQAGHFLGLDKALKGAGFAGKKHEVTLTTGETITAMNGAMAPTMWQAGEYDAVLAYLHDDVAELLKLAQWVEANRCIAWTSNAGRPRKVNMPELYDVAALRRLPEPDTSWMTDPPTREQFVTWMREYRTGIDEVTA